MRREPRIAFHPFVFALIPALALYSNNVAHVPAGHVARPAVLTLAATAVLWGLLTILLRNASRAGVITSAVILNFFAYRHLWQLTRRYIEIPHRDDFLAFWCLLASLLIVGAWAIGKKPKTTAFLNVASIALIAMCLWQLRAGTVKIRQDIDLKVSESGLASRGERSADPDIFYIVLDGYGRSDSLNKYMNYSNEPFIRELEKLGFYVAKQSHSNYINTLQSVASSLNLDYVHRFAPDVAPDDSSEAALMLAIQRNLARDFLKGQGYLYLLVSSGFHGITALPEDLELQDSSGITRFESVLMQWTPLRTPKKGRASPSAMHRQRINSAFDNLEEMGGRTAQPRFVVTHILAPHPPFVFRPDGTRRPLPMEYRLVEGPDFKRLGVPNWLQLYQEGYADQARYIETRTLRAIKQILQSSRSAPPVIILQGDHGSRAHIGATPDSTELDECFPILNAYYAPEPVKAALRPNVTPVNSFRILFNQLFGTEFSLLPDLALHSRADRMFTSEDVTDLLTKGPLESHEEPQRLQFPPTGLSLETSATDEKSRTGG